METSTDDQHNASSNSTDNRGDNKETNAASSTSTASALVISASFKAGMDGIDREKIDAIIMRESKDSLYMQQQVRRDQKVNDRIEQMKERLSQQDLSSKNWKRKLEHELEPEIQEILSGRKTRSTACGEYNQEKKLLRFIHSCIHDCTT